ncbi:hypothetical protein ACFE04_016157 [Oxalis oulophora]
MLPNLELILVALLYGSFISCVMLIAIFVIMNSLLLAFSLILFSIVLFDFKDGLSLLRDQYSTIVEPSVKLGFSLILGLALLRGINVVSNSRESFENIKVKFRHDKLREL